MTMWPLICESCGTEVYVGPLYGDGRCLPCERQHFVMERIRSARQAEKANTAAQSSLGEFA